MEEVVSARGLQKPLQLRVRHSQKIIGLMVYKTIDYNGLKNPLRRLNLPRYSII